MNVLSKDFLEEFQYDEHKDFLGKGAFGEVYRAFSRLRKKNVVIKYYKDRGKSDFDLRNEIATVINLEHSSLIRYYSFYEVRYKSYHRQAGILEYANGGDLTGWLGNLPALDDIRYVVGDILRGLQFIEDQRMLHRDIKLQNILLHQEKNDSRVKGKIADFGLAKQMESVLFKDGAVKPKKKILGTPNYMAPELLDGRFATTFNRKPRIRFNSDLWSFGVMIYRLFLNEFPFSGTDSSTSHAKAFMNVLNKPLSGKVEHIPEPFKTMVKRCLVKHADKRVQTTDELIDLLKKKSIQVGKKREISIIGKRR